MKKNLLVLALAFLLVAANARVARSADAVAAPKGYVDRVIEIARAWWDRFHHGEAGQKLNPNQNQNLSLSQNQDPHQSQSQSQVVQNVAPKENQTAAPARHWWNVFTNRSQNPNQNQNQNPNQVPNPLPNAVVFSNSPNSQSLGRVAAALRLLVAHLPVVSTVTIQPVTVPPRAGIAVIDGLSIPTTFLPGRPKKPVPALAALSELAPIKARERVASKLADPQLETAGPFHNNVQLTALEPLTPEKIAPVQRDMMKLLHGLFSWLLLRQDEALGLIHDVGQKTAAPLVRQKAFAFEGWMLEGGQKGLASLAFWRSLTAAQPDGGAYVDAVAQSLSSLASSDVAISRSAPRESVVTAASATKNLSRDARAFLTLVQAERAYDHAHFADARRLARAVPAGSAWSEAARYLAAISLIAPKDDPAATATAGRELTELFRVVEDPRIFDATAATLGRIHFLLGNYKAAHQYLAQTSRDTNLFIDAAVDNAWALLRASDRNQAVGNMFTLHTPYFEGAYMPESYFLQGLGYQESCQFGDALTTVRQFKARYAGAYKALGEFNTSNKGAAEDPTERRESGRGGPFYNDLVAYLSQHDAKLPGLVLRELGRRPEFLRRQKELNRLAHDSASVVQQFPLNGAKVTSWLQDEMNELRRVETASMEQFLKHRAGEMQDELKFLTANVSLLEYEVLANAAQNLSLQGAQNFAVDEKRAVTKADLDAAQKEYWPYEDEIWEDELNNFRSKMLDGCASRKPAGS